MSDDVFGQEFMDDTAMEVAERILDSEPDLSDEEIRELVTDEVMNLFWRLPKEARKEIDVEESIDGAMRQILGSESE